jgi:predicted enzyme related to lactoylglutathione lyase
MSDQPGNGEFCWNELMTTDTRKAKAFYEGLLGWKSQDLPMEGMTYTMFSKGEKNIGGLIQIPAEAQGTIPSHWMSYILVANLSEMVKKAESLGAQVKRPVSIVPGMGHFAILSDPSGAHIALWEPMGS